MDRISWDEYYMTMAVLASKRSKDPSTQVGSVIVSSRNTVISTGYNGMPRGVEDAFVSWKKSTGLDNKYLYVCHAELNAISNTPDLRDTVGATIYVTLFPCNECAKIIIQRGFSKIVYLSDKYHDQLAFQASRKMLEAAGIKLVEYNEREFDIVERNKK